MFSQDSQALALTSEQTLQHAQTTLTAVNFSIPSDFGWNDVGSWEALSDYNEADADGNITAGRVIAGQHELNHSVPRTGNFVLGMESVVIVSTNDAILVCPKGLVQRVKEIPALAKALDWRDLC